MAEYFNLSDEKHKDLLSDVVLQKADVLPDIIELAEFETIQRYKKDSGKRYDAISEKYYGPDTDYVYLRWYTADSEDCENEDFKYAMAVTIARVAKHIASHLDRETDLQFWSMGSQSEQYRRGYNGLFKALRWYDLRPTIFVM